MSFKIDIFVTPKAKTGVFSAVIRYMHGDADHYQNSDEIVIGDAAAAQRFLECIDYISGYDSRDHNKRRRAPYYLEFFTSLSEDEDDDGFRNYQERLKSLETGWGEDYWPKDVVYAVIDAAFDGFRLFWHNELGECCLTEVRRQDGTRLYQSLSMK